MMRPLIRPTTALLLATGTCLAQTVSPALFRLAPANSSDSRPFAAAGSRWLQVHDDLRGQPMTVRSLSFRLEEALSGSPIPAFQLNADLWMSTAVTTATAPSSTFALNHGADRTQVLARTQIVQFPAMTVSTPLPGFEYRIPLATPFVFGGQGPLAWEAQVQSTTSFVSFDAVLGSQTNPRPFERELGDGCVRSGGALGMSLFGYSTVSWSSGAMTNNYSVSLAPTGATPVLMIGLGYAPIVLPGTASGASGPCTLATVPVNVLPMANPTRYALPLALSPAFHGAILTSQAFALDPGANALGVVSSNAFTQVFAAPYGPAPVGRVSSSSASSATGLAFANTGLVIGVR
ncbi:MAG: hypothetical protein IPM29_27470 [Planctomycetes bacterium]|nr:hypothetical protein [Planctomycetota bacterium]